MSIDIDPARIVVDAQRVRLVVDLGSGRLALEDPAGRWPSLEATVPSVNTSEGSIAADGPWSVESAAQFDDSHGAGQRVILASAPGRSTRSYLELCSYDDGSLVLLRLAVRNEGERAFAVHSLTPFGCHWDRSSAGLRPNALRWYRHGWQSWTPSLALGVAQGDIDVRPPVSSPTDPDSRRRSLASEEVTILLDSWRQRGLMVGFVSAHQQWTQVKLDPARRSLMAVAHADGLALGSGQTIWSERLMLEFADEPEAALSGYAEVLAREMHARVPRTSPVGWCSWYYYFTTVSEADVLQNLRFLEQHKRELPVGLVQIDDGYQADIGDWTTTNEKFPRGMAPLARDITEAGFTPGIWLAPFLFGERSQSFQGHPDWVIHDELDEPVLAMNNWAQRNYGLDCSRPDVQRWLLNLFREVTEGWGYQYVKVDFLYGAALAGKRQEGNVTRVESYRRGLKAIRQGVGDDRFILGCGALMGASVGVIDAQRIGPDVAPWWSYRPRGHSVRRGRRRIGGEPATDNAVRNIFTRSWMHGRLWASDPDCLLARQTRTKLSLQEVQTLATAIALSGGAWFASDDLTQLSADRIDLMSALLPIVSDPVHVNDLMLEEMPSTMTIEVERPFERWLLAARFNWSSRSRDLEFALPPGQWHAFDFWPRRYEGVFQDAVQLKRVPPHGVRLVALRPVLDRPQLVGSTFHITMGGEELRDVRWDARREELQVDLHPVPLASGSLYLHVPEDRKLIGLTRDGETTAVQQLGQIAVAQLQVDDPTVLRFRFG